MGLCMDYGSLGPLPFRCECSLVPCDKGMNLRTLNGLKANLLCAARNRVLAVDGLDQSTILISSRFHTVVDLLIHED